MNEQSDADQASQKSLKGIPLGLFSKDELIDISKRISSYLKDTYKVEDNELIDDKTKSIPVEIFAGMLSPSEAIVKFLKEERGMNYHEIGELIRRDERGVWNSYQRSLKKQSKPFDITTSSCWIPYSAFEDKQLSILERVVLYLKDDKDMKGSAIANLLSKKSSTIWTAYNRAKEKRRKYA